MALDENGLDIPRLPELQEELAVRLQEELGVPIDTSSNAVAGIINAVLAAADSNLYELLQAVYDQRRLETAEGVNLDDLVSYTGITRLASAPSRTDTVQFTGDGGTNIPQNSVVTNAGTLDRYVTESPVTIETTACYSSTFSVATLLDSTQYDIIVNGSNYVYTSGVGATEDEIIDGLLAAFGTPVGYIVTKVDTALQITSNFLDININISASTLLATDSVTGVGVLVSEESGEIPGSIGSLTQITTPVSGWVSVINPEAVILGRDRESDEDLLARQQESQSITGAGTLDAILSRVRALAGVTAATIVENDKSYPDAEFRPPKSFEVLVNGGLDESIAQAIWDTKSAGIETVGTTTATAVDLDNFPHEIKFTRPVDVYIHVRVTYTLYDEEAFPINGDALIAQAVLEYGDSLELGEDVIPKRFYGPIYSSVQGIEDLVVEIDGTPNPNDTPTYSTNVVEIDDDEDSNFALTRIEVIAP